MPGYHGVTGHVVSVQHFADDGTCTQASWKVDDDAAAWVARELGEPDYQTVLTAEQMDEGNAAIGSLPAVWRPGV